MRLCGVDRREEAERFRGAELRVLRDDLEPLAEGEYYLADLVGAAVVGPEGPVGKVVGLFCYPTLDCLIVEMMDGRRAEQPLDDAWLERVDVQTATVHLRTLEALLITGEG